MNKKLHYVFLVLLALLFWNFINQHERILANLDFKRILPFLISGGVFLFLYLVYFHRVLGFWAVFGHELTHLLFAMICFKRIEGFSVSFSGGAVSYRGSSNRLVRLAPYFFPVYTFFLIIPTMIITSSQLKIYFLHLTAVSYIFYLIALFHPVSFRQPDISNSGYAFSAGIIVIMNLLVLSFVLFFLQDNTDAYWQILINSFDYRRLIDV